jgi:hypothetical protein
MTIQVESVVEVQEVDGEWVDDQTLRVRSRLQGWVELEIDGRRLTISAPDLHAAIENATNTA